MIWLVPNNLFWLVSVNHFWLVNGLGPVRSDSGVFVCDRFFAFGNSRLFPERGSLMSDSEMNGARFDMANKDVILSFELRLFWSSLLHCIDKYLWHQRLHSWNAVFAVPWSSCVIGLKWRHQSGVGADSMGSAPTPLWWRHFRPITQDDHGTANTAFHECKRWCHKYLSIQWSKLLQNKRNSNDKITSLFAISNRAPFISESDMREPRSGNNRLLPNAKSRSHTNTPESDRTGPNPLTNQKWFTLTNQNRLFGTNQITAFVH